MKEIKEMSFDELKQYLDDLRLSRRKGYDRQIKVRSKKQTTPECLKDVDENLAALVLAELAKKK